MPVLLIFVRDVSSHKFIELASEPFTGELIFKAKAGFVVDKHIIRTFLNVLYLPAIIPDFIKMEVVLSFMSHFFALVFPLMDIVIALNPKFDESVSFSH